MVVYGRSLNLRGCRRISDSGICALAKGCARLQVLNVATCNLLTDESIKVLAEHCRLLRSLNLCMVSKITDESLHSLGKFSTCLQALNLAGCKLVSELGICSVADSCRALQVLNVTGCENVTQNGLDNLCEGLSYVELATTYTGFKPLEGSSAQKLKDQLRLVKNNASAQITALFRGNLTRVTLHKASVEATRREASTRIQSWVRAEAARRQFRRLLRHSLEESSSLCIQCCWRRFIAQRFTSARRELEGALKRFARQFTLVQAFYRGRCARDAHPEVVEVLQLKAEERRVEAMGAVTVRLQAHFRRKVCVRRNRAYMEELDQRSKDIAFAATKMQSVVRMSIAKGVAARRKAWLLMVYAKEIKACTEIQRVFRGWKGRKLFQQVFAKYQRQLLKRIKAATDIQRTYRGHLGHKRFVEAKRWWEYRSNQATKIQSVFRMHAVPAWRKIKFDRAKAFIARRSREDSLRAEQEILRREGERELKLGVDSCSEASGTEDCPENDWQEHWDEETDQIFFFSPSRGVSTLEKYSGDEFQQGLVGMRVKFSTENDTKEHSGEITRYNRAKNKHRIQLSKDKRVWVNIRECETRVQIYDPVYEVWTMYRNFRMQNTRYGRKSRQTSGQWQGFADEASGQVYFYNVTTGKLYLQHADSLIYTKTNLMRLRYLVIGETLWQLPESVDPSTVEYH